MVKKRFLACAAACLATVLALSACGGNGFDSGSKGTSGSTDSLTSSKQTVKVLIGSSGDAETDAVKKAVDDWARKSGQKAKVIVARPTSSICPPIIWPVTPRTALCSPTGI